jgi:tetratricopeptide (TPR) repeat protein
MQAIKQQISQGDLSSAEQSCRRRLAQQPGDTLANFLLGFILWKTSRPQEALGFCLKARDLAPDDPGMLNDLGNLLRELGALEDAYEALDRSLKLRPDHSGTKFNQAMVLEALGSERASFELIKSIGPEDPFYAKARFFRGTARQGRGDMAGAESDFCDCIAADGGNAEAWYAWAQTRRFEPGEEIFGMLQKQLSTTIIPGARCRYLFALAKVHDDIGQYDVASDELLHANRLVDARYDREGIEKRLEAIRLKFRHLPALAEHAKTALVPVFIIGLPRSGSTLVETLIEKHPKVTALGELELLPNLIPDPGAPWEFGQLRQTGIRYMESIPSETQLSALFTDKMPANFWRLGHIASMWPSAKLVHCRRDPRDVMISNFFNLYGTGNSFAYSLENLAHYTVCHNAVMQHWRELLGSRIFEVDYEELVKDTQQCMASAADFLDLDWEESMLEAAPTERRIRTASKWQVRQEIYATSVGRWKRYPRLTEAFMSHYRKFEATLGKGEAIS